MTNPTGRKRSDASGFALVVALSLMAFMLLLLLGMTTLVRVESRSAAAALVRLEARQNALLALRQALGELQKHAGPDQRATARSGVRAPFDQVSGDQLAFEEVAHPDYTLVWDVAGAENQLPGEVPGHDPALLPAVLVSGNAGLGHDFSADTDYPDNYATGTTPLDPADPRAVTLVETAGADPEPVRVRSVPVGDERGEIAWWIGDENTKARLNLDRDRRTTADAAPDWLAPQRFAPQLWPPLADAVPADLARTHRPSELPLLPDVGADEDAPPLHHDFSFHSRSLLTDVRNGGLKRDLTYGLDQVNPPPPEIADAAFLFPRDLGGAPNASPNFNFIQWGLFRDFYNFRPAGGTVASRAHRVPDTNGDESYEQGIHPVIARFQMGVYADYQGDFIRFRYMPAVVLWNPYSVDLSFPDLHLIFKEDRGNNRIEIRNIAVENDPKITNETFVISTMPFTIPSDTIAAGEAVIYSPDGLEPYSRDRMNPETGSGGGYGSYRYRDNTNDLEPGFRQGAGFTQIAWWDDPDDDKEDKKVRMEKTVEGNPRIRFAMQFNGRMYIDLHERTPLGGTRDKSQPDLYQLVTGMDADAALGSEPVQFYEPLVGGFPDPKFLFVYTIPFAETNFFNNSLPPRRWMGNLNPRAKVNTTDLADTGYEGLENYVGGFLADFEAEGNYPIQTSNGTNAFVGSSATFGGADNAVLFDLPRSAPVSIGRFAHANLLPPPAWNEANAEGIGDHLGRWSNNSFLAIRLSFTGAGDDSSPAYTVGSARANPYIDLKASPGLNQTRYWRRLNWNSHGDGKMVWDFPYLVNEVLFDRYFLSTVPQSGDLEPPFANPLMRPVSNNPDPARLRSFDKSAGELAVEGGFNVNSVSVEAWAAFLAALRDQNYGPHSGDGSPFPRFETPTGTELTEGDLSAYASRVNGFRRLNDARIRNLAERIVEQVKLRGPFPSMAAFVNRVMWEGTLYRDSADLASAAPDPHNLYPGSYDLEKMVMRKGALEAALELSEVNENFFARGETVGAGTSLEGGNDETAGFRGAIGTDLPGYLSQVDILALLAPGATVRSDTFTIRAYGKTEESAAGNDSAVAYCEAVVQRLPEFVNSGENDRADPPGEWSPANQAFGRRFHVVAFRWLDPDEI